MPDTGLMLHYFYGEDTYGAREAIGALVKKEQAKLRWCSADDLRNQVMGDQLGQQRGLFGAVITVLLDPSQWPAARRDELAALVAQKTAAAMVLWDRGKPDKRSKLWRALKAVAREFTALDELPLSAWLTREAQTRGATLEPRAAALLVQRLGRDRWRLLNELERLSLLSNEITVATVKREVPDRGEADIFSLLDALVAGQPAAAVRQIEVLLARGASELYIISMLAYQWRVLVMVNAGNAEGLTPGEIARAGRLHPYVVQKTLPAARRQTAAAASRSFTKIMATDIAIKRGRVDARTGLMMLVLSLARETS